MPYNFQWMNYDVGVIGGGVIGLACAWRMARAGARVALFERGKVGREASWAAAGMLAAQCEMAHHPPNGESAAARQAMFGLCLQSRALYPSFADELFDATGIDVELSLRTHARGDWRTPGVLYVRTHDNDLALAAFAMQHQRGLSAEDAPCFNGSRAIWLPDEGQVNNRLLVRALRAAALNAGVMIFQSSGEKCVSRLFDTHWDENRVNLDMRLETRCDKVLICAGAWSAGIGNLPDDCRPPVFPVAGEMMALRAFSKTHKRRVAHIVYGPEVYLVPRRDGRILVGATMRSSGFHKAVAAGGVAGLLNAAFALVPELRDFTIEEQWVGLRPATPDGLPILSKTSLDNLFVATGHFRNGILLAPVTARLMADCVLNGAEPPSAFSMERFAAQIASTEQTTQAAQAEKTTCASR